MKTGQTVNYYDEEGERHYAVIDAVVGKGASNFKTLDLSFRRDGEAVAAAGVPHENDADPGGAFWLEQGVPRRAPPTGPERPAAKSKKAAKK